MIQVKIPTPLKKLVGGVSEVTATGSTIVEIVDDLDRQFSGIKARLVNPETNKLNKFILFFVNDEDIRFLQNENSVVKAGDIVTIVPALAGG